MFRRFFKSIKNYIRGRPRPMPTKEMETQSKLSSQYSNSGSLAPPSVVFPSAQSSEKVNSHCPVHGNPIISARTVPPSSVPQPEITKPAARIHSSSLPRASKPSSSAPKASANTTTPIWETAEMNAETARMMENIMSNTIAFTQNIVDLCSNLSGDAGDTGTNGHTFNVDLNNGTTSFTRGPPQQGNAFSSSSRHTGPWFSQQSSGTAPMPGSDLGSGSHVFYETNGMGFDSGVFVTNGGILANVGNTISIPNGPLSTGYSSYGSQGGTRVWNVGSAHISTHSGSMSVDVFSDTVVVNGRKYAKKQGLGPLGRFTEITNARVVVDGHTYYPESESA